MAWKLGYPPVLWLSFGFLCLATILLIFRVREPRQRKVHPILTDELLLPESESA